MDRWRLIVDDGAGAAEGLATDEALMAAYGSPDPPPPTLRLYTYRTHCALVGRFQDPSAELHLDECAVSGTPVNRRPTGGGAIVMGEHQLGVALVTSLRDPRTPPHARAIIDGYAAGIVAGLARVGVDAQTRGKNDIAAGRRKIAGLGIYADSSNAVLFHASVLANLDVEFMLRVLNVPAAKLADKGVASVRERVTTVASETGRDVRVDELRAHVAAGFEETFGIRLAPEPPSASERALARRLVAEKYGTESWVMQRASEAPAGSAVVKTSGGLLRVSVGLSGEAIKDVLVTGDFMASDGAVAEIEAALRWTSASRDRVVGAVVTGVERGGGLSGVSTSEIGEAVWQAIVDARARRGAAGSCYYPDVASRREAATWR